MDLLIRKYGYRGTEHTLQMVEKRGDLRGSLSAAAHLIHGSSEGRFTITYAPVGLTKEEVEGVGFSYLPYEQAVQRYPLHKMQAGYNTMPDGEEVFFIPNPALGLWALKSQFEELE